MYKRQLGTSPAHLGPKHPLGRLGEPDEIARGAVFLASDDSTFMTGADPLIYGGYTCLLYTCDAADDTPCVDLGGRPLIPK